MFNNYKTLETKVMASEEKKLENQLLKVGNKLLKPPSSTNGLLYLLNVSNYSLFYYFFLCNMRFHYDFSICNFSFLICAFGCLCLTI